MNDHELAGYLAESAGAELLKLRTSAATERLNTWYLRDQGDMLSHKLLIDQIREHRPEDHVLSEEGADDKSRVDADRVWIIDPLDGSQDYPYPESAEWAVHIALIESGRIKAGAVACPSLGRHHVTGFDSSIAERKNEAPLIVSNRWNTYQASSIAETIGAELTCCGSAGVKTSLVLSGDADVYIHGSGLYEWDACGPVAVSRDAGLVAFQLDGSDFQFNKQTPVVRGLVISRPEYSDLVRKALSY